MGDGLIVESPAVQAPVSKATRVDWLAEQIKAGIWCPTTGADAVYAAERALDELRQHARFLNGMLTDAFEYLCDEVPHAALCGCTKPGDQGTCMFASWKPPALTTETAQQSTPRSSPGEAAEASDG